MKIAIVGYAIEGKAAADYWAKKGDHVTICDQNTKLESEIPATFERRLGETYLKDLHEFDVIVRTVGMHPHSILDANPEHPEIADRITTTINEFFKVSPTKNIIGVTGTKGKGTTSTLIARMLSADGRDVKLGGNIGVSMLSYLDEITPDSWVVFELSSFQLYDLEFSPHIGVCLMVVSEHLDWHQDMADYIGAKINLFRHQAADDVAIYFAGNEHSRSIAGQSSGRKVPFLEPPGAYIDGGTIVIDGRMICRTDELKLLGEHNWQNVCAAVTTVWQVTKNTDAMRAVLLTFTGLEHRLEFVRELDGVAYYDDSFGTAPETAIVAMRAFGQPKVVILGGSDKGANYEELAQAVKEAHVRKALLIGDQAERIRMALEGVGFRDFVDGGADMTAIVTTARAYARPGDVVLLSPACASFGMFKDYKDRGNQFKTVVQALA